MSDIAIRVEGLSKRYYIGNQRKLDARFSDQLADLFLAPFRRAGKLLRGQASGAAELDTAFWALNDVTFEIKQGEVVGVIGRNGAGKSTLLKLLSRITEPTKGYAEIYGRMSSLLEVGTGFHPELTGRDNIYLNGAILGMHKAEINRKFDDIVDFAEVGKFIDTPVKHYSSGMYVRLAFAVAAFLEPEILLVDEVLAVGDAVFQKKCLNQMDNVSKQGRTILFVSHNMNAVRRLCPKSILLSGGRLVEYGSTESIVMQYLASDADTISQPGKPIDLSRANREGTGRVRFASVMYSSGDQTTGDYPFPGGPLEFSLEMVADRPTTVGSIAATLYDQYGTKLVNADTLSLGEIIQLDQGYNQVRLRIKELHLNPGIYTLGLWVANPPSEVYDSITTAARIEVFEQDSKKISVPKDGAVFCDFEVGSATISEPIHTAPWNGHHVSTRQAQ